MNDNAPSHALAEVFKALYGDRKEDPNLYAWRGLNRRVVDKIEAGESWGLHTPEAERRFKRLHKRQQKLYQYCNPRYSLRTPLRILALPEPAPAAIWPLRESEPEIIGNLPEGPLRPHILIHSKAQEVSYGIWCMLPASDPFSTLSSRPPAADKNDDFDMVDFTFLEPWSEEHLRRISLILEKRLVCPGGFLWLTIPRPGCNGLSKPHLVEPVAEVRDRGPLVGHTLATTICRRADDFGQRLSFTALLCFSTRLEFLFHHLEFRRGFSSNEYLRHTTGLSKELRSLLW